MCSITFYDGRRVNYDEYGAFSDAREILKYSHAGYVSYYDASGDTHVCEFALVENGLMCLGETTILKDSTKRFDCTGVHYDSNLYEVAAKVVRWERSEEFCGWSI